MVKKQKKLFWFIDLIFAIILTITWAFLVKNHTEKNKHHIPVAMALDDGYLYPTIVAITSMIKNADNNTVYDYYIMHPQKFSNDSKTKLQSLGQKHSNCNINLIDMGQAYKLANNSGGHITTPAYYRLSLSDLLPNLDKILWIDGDTLTFGNLYPMYNIDMDGLYYRGFLDDNVNAAKPFGIENDHYICDGVMVVNLAELRKDGVVEQFKNFIEKNNDKLTQHDQTVINVVCYNKTAKLDPKYSIFNYYCTTKEEITKYRDKLLAKDKYTLEELLEAQKHPILVHCVSKPWNKKTKFFDKWWKYAKMTDYYDEIIKKYGAVFNT